MMFVRGRSENKREKMLSQLFVAEKATSGHETGNGK